MRLGLGPTTVLLQDGLGSWNGSAADALAIWNGYLDFVHVSSVASTTVPQASGDGVNTVFFSGTIFGDSFGQDTLAVTVLLDVASRPGTLREADVIVNSAYRYNSYRGPLHSGAVFDLHRIFLHEFGHVLDLDHVITTPDAAAIMKPFISDWDHLGADDIEGVRSIYGADFYYPPITQILTEGYSVDNVLRANNHPTSYSATAMPPGVTLLSNGQMVGTPTKGGVYSAVVTAHGPIANAYTPLQTTVLGLDLVPGLLKTLFLGVVSKVADPIRPRIYLWGYNGISIIDTRTFQVTNVHSDFVFNARLSISADASTLLLTNQFAPAAQEFRIDLNSLTALPTLAIPGNDSAVLEGLNNQAYVAGRSGVFQFNATTGESQHSFAPPKSTSTASPTIAISADRQTLYVARATLDGDLSVYDISTPDPVLLHQLSGCFSYLAPSPDGQYLYYTITKEGRQSLIQAHLPALSPVKLVLTSNSHLSLGPTAVGPNGSIYQSVIEGGPDSYPTGSIVVYDPTILHQIAKTELTELASSAFPREIVFDNSGTHFFASVGGQNGTELWAFSTDLASFPPPVHPTKNLLNISTRGRVETGDNAMIGGFIVQGSKPKKVAIRGIGPSLPITGAMANPVLELYDSSGRRLASNDNWTSNRINILGTLLAPSSPRESALSLTLQPGAYTTIVRDLNNQPGLALVEVYDIDQKNSRLGNISTRGKVGTGDNVLIGGFVVGGADPTKVIIRAIGPSLAGKGIGYPLADPTLELHDGTGKLLARNDDWRSTQSSQIIATGIPPTDNREAVILKTLQPGNYTAIVRGKNGATGVALVEVYNLDSSTPAAE